MLGISAAQAAEIDLTHATIVARGAGANRVERTAIVVLAEETEKRSGVRLPVTTEWPSAGPGIAVLSGAAELYGAHVPEAARIARAEGYSIATDLSNAARPRIWIYGADPRGALFGVGRLLRALRCAPGRVALGEPLSVASAPVYPIRGHQLGYRATANSYDAWSVAQFDQYIRELALFGANSVEGIPFHDTRPTVNAYPRQMMNQQLSRICQRYGMDYWLWIPADFDLKDAARRAKHLADQEALFNDCPTISAVFVPGGDPGDNPPELVIPYLSDLAQRLTKRHAAAKVWVSMQGFSPEHQEAVYRWIDAERPKWLGGLVAGPSSPPVADVRARLARPYRLRDYPDITHSVRCQFGVPWWDPAFAMTLGRECVNPRPAFFSRVVRDTAPYTDGFLSYSDGIHDDLNKVVWTALEWDPSADLNTVLTEYARLFFGGEVAAEAAAGLFAFERNWDGPLAVNGGVDASFALWRDLEKRAPELKLNWRWQLYLLRAYYDMYTRHRLLYESSLEEKANAQMLAARALGAEKAIAAALKTLEQAEKAPIRTDLSVRVEQLCEQLYRSIGLQTSVAKYHAAGSERGAVLDFLYYPLNNRWWLEDELAKVRKLPSEGERIARLETIAKWEHPGSGSFYDDIGNVAKSPHEVRNEKLPTPLLDVDNSLPTNIMFWTGTNPNARVRQSWFTDEAWPEAMKYTAIDPGADYVIRTTGFRDCRPRVNGTLLAPTVDGKGLGEIKEFPVPRDLYRSGMITVTFDPISEPELNWRVKSRLTEIWLIKR